MFACARPRLGQWQCVRNVSIKHNVNFNECNCFANKAHTEMNEYIWYGLYLLNYYSNLKQTVSVLVLCTKTLFCYI